MGETSSERTELPSADWIEAAADLMICVGTDRFSSALRHILELACRFESMLVTAHEGNAAPKSLYHDLNDLQAAVSVEFYSSGPFLLDPFYIASRNNIDPGAYRLLDVAPKSFLRSDYYRTFYRKIRLHDEMAILLRNGEDNWIIVSLARTRTRARFDEEERDRVNRLFPLIEAAILRHWAKPGGNRQSDASTAADRLRGFASDVLSPREADIIHLILQGHSTRTISTFLGIAEGTVKVHRHHAYGKLGIHSQSELFSLATDYLATLPS
ncbi:helix-turn-helix transcriptional regulator [Roseibium sp.]|uniref:helix-turn-helix transcriptional regulator n=1 Tax=Roseibium sp. TaxID=1936156 RepID=UPI003D0B2CF1